MASVSLCVNGERKFWPFPIFHMGSWDCVDRFLCQILFPPPNLVCLSINLSGFQECIYHEIGLVESPKFEVQISRSIFYLGENMWHWLPSVAIVSYLVQIWNNVLLTWFAFKRSWAGKANFKIKTLKFRFWEIIIDTKTIYISIDRREGVMYGNFDRVPHGGMSNFQEIFLTNICDMDLLVRLRYIIIILDMQPMK